MFDDALFVLTLLSALGCGLVGGVFFAFSSFVMKGLDRLPPGHGAAAMNSINVTVLNPSFLGVFMGTAATSVLLIVTSPLDWSESESIYRLVGAGLYLIGSIVVTKAINVPQNDELAAVDPNSPEGATRWVRYVPEWTAWNTVRAFASFAASAAFIFALIPE